MTKHDFVSGPLIVEIDAHPDSPGGATRFCGFVATGDMDWRLKEA